MPSRSIAESQSNGDAGGASRPELVHSDHNSYLSAPLDLRASLSTKPDNLDHGKELALEMDGEWFGDAQEAASSAVQKQNREPDSPAMTLLRSITKASADAVPGLSASPLPWEGHRSRLRPREQYSRPGASGGGSGGGLGGGGSRGSPTSPGDFYRLPWYRRPLPSPRPSGAAASLDLRRRHSMLSAPRSGLRPPSTIVEGSLVSGGAGASRGRTAARDPPRPAPGQQAPTSGGFVAPMPRVRGAAKTPQPPSDMAPTVPPTQHSAAAGATAAATAAAAAASATDVSEMATAAQVSENEQEEERGEPVGVLEVVVADGATAGAKPRASDRDVVAEGGPPANAGVGADVAVREVSGGEDSGEIRRLKAELDRLKREMAAMAAATAAATTPQPGATPGSDFGPPRIEVTTPVPSEGRSAWQWADGKPPGVSERPKSTRNLGRAVRADDSWMQRRRSGRYHHRRSSSETLTSAFVGGVLAGSVLPTPTSDGGSSGGQLSFSNRGGGHHHHHSAVDALSPPRHSLGSLGEGPSPASGEKAEGAAAAAAERRAGGRGSSAGGDRGSQNGSQGGSARSSASVRPFPVFFPVQASRRARGAEALAPPPPKKVPRDGPAAAVAAVVAVAEAAEAVEAVQAAVTTTAEGENAVAKKVNGDSGELTARAGGAVKRDSGGGGGGGSGGGGGGGAGGGVSGAEPGAYDKVVVSSPPAVTAGRRRERPSVGRARVWRWVLAQRTGNQTVRQALLTHGLPPLDRRHIWAAWAAVAKPEGVAGRRAGAPSDPAAQGSVASIIVHDVQRTKIVHPLFASGGPGMAMLKRVLLRCAELGAVKEAGYIQGMNYLAGFLLITFADCIAADRVPPPDHPGGRSGGSNRDPTSTTASGNSGGGGGGVSLQPELPPSMSREGAAGGEGGREAEAQPSAADVDLIEREAVEVMLGIIALQGGVLSRDLWGLHANTELVETLLSKHCPDIMEHLRTVSLELIVLTPRWFICIYAGSMASQPVVSRIWDLFTWYGRRGPAVLVWVALGILHGCRARILESRSLPAAVKAVRRHAEGCRSFDELIRQAPVGLNQVVAAWEEQGENRRIAAMDGDGAVPDKMVAGLVQEMTGEQMLPPPMEDTSPQAHRRSTSGYAPSTSTPAGFGIQFPSTPGRPPTPLSSPRSPFPDWAASIFRSSTGGGGGLDAEGFSAERGDGERPPASPRYDATPARTRPLRRAASTSWW